MREIILAKTKRPFKSLIKKELPENATADDVLTHLFGDVDGWINSDYTVREYEPECKSNVIQRILWLPILILLIVIICPLKWLITGRYGLKTESKIYEFINFLTGFGRQVMSDLKELIERLKAFNEWRRNGTEIESPRPKQLGEDIDKAIELLEKLSRN